jgi:glycosyltransferase involved in cell wall biosynthesis
MATELRRICINSQTPLVRFLLSEQELRAKYPNLPDPIPLESLQEGVDFVATAGGVVQVVLPLIRRLLDRHDIDLAYWLSLLPLGPRRITWSGISLHGVKLDESQLDGYARAKEKLWNLIHGLPTEPLDPSDFVAFTQYNWECTRSMFGLVNDVDLFYVHDFQQIQTGTMIGLSAPAVLRWHIPLRLDRTPESVRRFLLRSLEGFDAVIVSCRRDLEGLISLGFRGRARQIYPTLDPDRFVPVAPEQRRDLMRRLGIEAGASVVLCVARMDPMKRQDTLLWATERLKDRFPHLKVVLVGNGSFTGAAQGGLGQSKSGRWRGQLENQVRELGIGDRVVFAGNLNHSDLCAAYDLCHVTVLPSQSEGFGLVVPEAWIYERPVVVSQGAGASELVVDGSNGYTFPPGDTDTLTKHLETLLLDQAARRDMGRKGHDTARICFAENQVPQVLSVLQEAKREYR